MAGVRALSSARVSIAPIIAEAAAARCSDESAQTWAAWAIVSAIARAWPPHELRA